MRNLVTFIKMIIQIIAIVLIIVGLAALIVMPYVHDFLTSIR